MSTITRRAMLAAAPAVGLAPIVPAVADPVDPMFELISEYRKQMAAFDAIPDEALTRDSEPEYVAATYGPSMLALLNDAPPTTSIGGVREAIRLAFEEEAFICSLSENVLRSALAYLDRRVA